MTSHQSSGEPPSPPEGVELLENIMCDAPSRALPVETELELRAEVERLKGELGEAGQYTEAHERLDDLARERVAAAEARATQAEMERDEAIDAQFTTHPDNGVDVGWDEMAAEWRSRATCAEASLSRLKADVVGFISTIEQFGYSSALALSPAQYMHLAPALTLLREGGMEDQGSSSSSLPAHVADATATEAQHSSGGETGWLLESTTPWPGGTVHWFGLLDKPYRAPRSGRREWHTYTSDPNLALRFQTKEEAESYRDHRGLPIGLRCDLIATEHEWPFSPAESNTRSPSEASAGNA